MEKKEKIGYKTTKRRDEMHKNNGHSETRKREGGSVKPVSENSRGKPDWQFCVLAKSVVMMWIRKSVE